MIELHRLNGERILINPDHILWLESTPDTVITLVGGMKLTVKNSEKEVREQFAQYKKEIHSIREVKL